MEQDTRLTNLEIKLSFTEDMVEELNKTVFRQQQHIDWLLREVDKLRQQMPEGAVAGSRTPGNEAPPHY
ncbi:MAG: SlyX family protein [Rhodoferax sp.]|nr:SlyX family protein [Rhodoferax sp.]MCB2007254.1 SlyX family protein [Rhodoferax sp.]